MDKTDTVLAQDRVDVINRISAYEKTGGESFFENAEIDPPTRPILPHEVDYLNKKLSSKIKTFFACIIEGVGKRVLKKKFDITVVGEENIRDIEGGAIITSNHFGFFESLNVKLASEKAKKKHKLYKVVREGNFFMTGLFGFLLRHCRTLPLSSNLHTMKKLDLSIAELLKKDNFILIYPEQALWWNYPKPRPYRIGAYHYAAKNNVPIIPCFVTLSKKGTIGKNGFPDLKYTIHIMKPIYPDPDKKVRDNAKEMQEENSRLTFAKYEEVYGVPVTYGDYSLESALNGVIK